MNESNVRLQTRLNLLEHAKKLAVADLFSAEGILEKELDQTQANTQQLENAIELVLRARCFLEECR